MKKTYLASAALLLCASSVAHAGPRPPVLLNVLNPLLQPVLSITAPIAGGLVATGAPIAFGFIGNLTVHPVATLLGPVAGGGKLAPLPGLK